MGSFVPSSLTWTSTMSQECYYSWLSICIWERELCRRGSWFANEGDWIDDMRGFRRLPRRQFLLEGHRYQCCAKVLGLASRYSV